MTKITLVKALLISIEAGAPHFLELTRSLKKTFAPGMADLPGGKVEPGESLIKAIIREIQEETGIQINSLHNITSHHWVHGTRQYDEHLYCTVITSKQNIVLAYNEHESYCWMPLQNIHTSSLLPMIKQIIIDKMQAIQKVIENQKDSF